MDVDGISQSDARRAAWLMGSKNRPIVLDSGRSRSKSESRKFPFEIKSEKF